MWHQRCYAQDEPIPAKLPTSGPSVSCSTRCWSVVIRSTTPNTRPCSPKSRAANLRSRRVSVRVHVAWYARCWEKSHPKDRMPRTCRDTHGCRSPCGSARHPADPRPRIKSYQSYLTILKTDSSRRRTYIPRAPKPAFRLNPLFGQEASGTDARFITWLIYFSLQ